jgi:hypothetical protein
MFNRDPTLNTRSLIAMPHDDGIYETTTIALSLMARQRNLARPDITADKVAVGMSIGDYCVALHRLGNIGGHKSIIGSTECFALTLVMGVEAIIDTYRPTVLSIQSIATA